MTPQTHTANAISRAVLERCLDKLAMMRLSAVSWYDLGTPERVVKTINELGIRPEWLAALQGVGNHRRAARTNARTRIAANSLFKPALFLN
jgi:2-hydroxychromene-2-carboxylate isomerase